MAVATVPNLLSPAQLGNVYIIERFLAYLRVEKGLRPLTVDAYQRDVAQFAEWLDAPIMDAGFQQVREYIDHLLSIGKARSAARKVSTLRHFYKFLFIDGLITLDPMHRIERPQIGTTLPKFLSASETDTVLSQTPNEHECLTRRNQAILELLYAAGLRVSEIGGAKLMDLNLADRYLIVRGKGDKERMVPFGHPAANALRHYLPQRYLLTKDLKEDSACIFVGRYGEKLTRQRLWQIVNGRSEGIGRNVAPHMLRHACATGMMNNGADLRTIQTILGHCDVSTTEIYTHVAAERLHKVYMQHHPRARVNNQGQLNLVVEPASPKTLMHGPVLCAHCMQPICEESKWYCALHLQLVREASKRSRKKHSTALSKPARKRLAAEQLEDPGFLAELEILARPFVSRSQEERRGERRVGERRRT